MKYDGQMEMEVGAGGGVSKIKLQATGERGGLKVIRLRNFKNKFCDIRLSFSKNVYSNVMSHRCVRHLID